MNRIVCRWLVCVSAILCLTISVYGGNKPKPSSSAIDAVARLLEKESNSETASLDRREMLKPESRPVSDPDSVWWQAGFIHSGGQWLPYENSVAEGEQAANIEEYRKQRTTLAVEPHGAWKLANWCRKNGMLDQERVHLLQVLADRDPTVKSDTVYERLGCRKVGEGWVSPQERLETARIKSEIETSFKRWESKLAAIIQQLEGTPKQRKLAERRLAEITDPSAVPAILNAFCLSTQSMADYGVRTISQIPEYQASRALAGQAAFSPWKPVRTTAIELLKQRKLVEFAPDLLLMLSNPVRTKHNLDVQTDGFRVPNFRLNWDYAWIEETHDTIRVGIRRLFPISSPSGFATGSGFSPTFARNPSEARAELNARIGSRLLDLFDQSENLDYTADLMNDARKEINERVGVVLSSCSEMPMTSEPKIWWNWWANYSDSQLPTQKNIVVVDERKTQPNVPSIAVAQRLHSCLVAGTPVWTERGFVAIEQIQPGDRVLAKDVETGELAYKPVLQTTIRPPTPVHQFEVDGKTIVASLGHHFWISGEGWTKTRELILDHPVHTVTGMRRITLVEDKGEIEPVYNLVVADFHTYFVGDAMVLSHDVLPPSLTNVKIPGILPR